MNDVPSEVCNGVDDDCDGIIDDGVLLTFYQDLDNDNFGNNSITHTACSAPTGYKAIGGDCNDNNNLIYPGAQEVCNNVIDDNCNGLIDETMLFMGLTAWFPFSGNATDESPNTNDGTVTNAILTTDKNGVANKAYEFNGTNARIDVVNNPNMNHANFTISAWVQYGTLPTGASLRGLVTKQFNGNSSYYLYWQNGKINAYTSNGTTSSTLIDNSTVYPTGPAWFHVAYTFDDVNNVNKLYVNGVNVATGAPTYSVVYNTNPVVMGAGYTGSAYNNYYTGKIDDVRIYNFAANENQIMHIMNDVTPEVCNGVDDDCDGLVDEGLTQTNTFTNSSGNNDWNNVSNWSLGIIPAPCHNVIIDVGLNSNILTGTSNAKSVHLKTGSILNISSGSRLDIYFGPGIFDVHNQGTLNVDGILHVHR